VLYGLDDVFVIANLSQKIRRTCNYVSFGAM